MSFSNTELEGVRKKKLLKSDLIGLTAGQYILYRINLASAQHIDASSLKFSVDEIVMDNPKPGELCDLVAVVKIRPGDGVIWSGEMDYRIPQINVPKNYGESITLPFEEIKGLAAYNDVARAFLLPPKSFKTSEFVGLGDAALSYRLNFNNPFFVGSLRVDVTGINNLITDKPLVDELLGIQVTTRPLSSALPKKHLSGLEYPTALPQL